MSNEENHGQSHSFSSSEDPLDKLTLKIDALGHSMSGLNLRLDRLEAKFGDRSGGDIRGTPSAHANAHRNAHTIHVDLPNQARGGNPSQDLGTGGAVGPGPNLGTAANVTDDLSAIQEHFNSIKSSVERVVLPPNLKLHDARTGVKKEDQTTLNVLSRCGRYIETALKVLSQVDEDSGSVDLTPLVVTLLANIRYLQDEYAALLVKGRFDNPTAQLFRSLQRHNSGFDSQNIQNVRVAAELASIGRSNNRNADTFYNRGGFRGSFSNRGRGYRDMLRGSSFPRNRNQFFGNSANNTSRDQQNNDQQ